MYVCHNSFKMYSCLEEVSWRFLCFSFLCVRGVCFVLGAGKYSLFQIKRKKKIPHQIESGFGVGFSVLNIIMWTCFNSCYSPKACFASCLLLISFRDVCIKFSIVLNYRISAFCLFPFVRVLVDLSIHLQ